MLNEENCWNLKVDSGLAGCRLCFENEEKLSVQERREVEWSRIFVNYGKSKSTGHLEDHFRHVHKQEEKDHRNQQTKEAIGVGKTIDQFPSSKSKMDDRYIPTSKYF